MALTPKRDPQSGVHVVVATCDDCDKVLAIATHELIVAVRLQRQRPDWRLGDALFCVDDTAGCAERTWERYGRYLQHAIEGKQAGREG